MAKVGDKVTAYIPVYAEYAIQVTVTEEMLEEGSDVDYDLVLDEAYAKAPGGVCAQCSGWGQDWSLELDGSTGEVQYIEDSTGKTVWGDFDTKLGG